MSFSNCPTETKQLIFQHAIEINKSDCYDAHIDTKARAPLAKMPSLPSSRESDPTHLVNITKALGAEICIPVLMIAKDAANRDLKLANEALDSYDDELGNDEEGKDENKAKEYMKKLFKAIRAEHDRQDHQRMIGKCIAGSHGSGQAMGTATTGSGTGSAADAPLASGRRVQAGRYERPRVSSRFLNAELQARFKIWSRL